MTTNRARRNNENIIPIQDLLFHCLSKWYWFVLSLVVTFTIAVLYIKCTPPVYTRSTEILIKEEGKGRVAGGENNVFKDFGSAQSTASTLNEIKALQSPGIMREVVKRLALATTYKRDGKFHDVTLYNSSPFTVKFLDLREKDEASFTAEVRKDGTLLLTGFTPKNGIIENSGIKAHIGDTVQSPAGRLAIHATEHHDALANERIHVYKRNPEAVVNEFCSNLSARLVNEETTIVKITIKDVSTTRAKEILSTITDIYNEQWLTENNQIAIKTAEFIGGRIIDVEKELRALDREIAEFQNENMMPDAKSSGIEHTAEITQNENELAALDLKLEMANFLKAYMNENAGMLLPTEIMIEVAGFENMVVAYNNRLLERNRIAANSSASNPIVAEIDKELASTFATIEKSLDNYIAKLNSDVQKTNNEKKRNNADFVAGTDKVMELHALLRQQSVKNALYLFLLQKREETELTKEFTASNNRILVEPMGSNRPIAPMQRQSMTLALIIGLMVPFIAIFLREVTNRKVRGRKDIEGLKVPFLGEIPLYQDKNKKKTKKGEKEEKKIYVRDGSRDLINEAFRVLRTNLEFMNDKEKSSTVILLTSFNPGSGKTFLTMNIGASLAVKGKRVLVIDGDMRHGSTSSYVDSPEIGLSDYLSHGVDNIADIIVNEKSCKTLDVIPIGSTPPNPTELLHDKRFGELLERMREKYEYILIDCPPLDIVADTQIIEEYVDRSIFVIRAGLLERDMLNELEDIYDEKRLRNLSVILNGTYSSQGRYSYKYGYRYSYRYGYGYGYGYNYHYHNGNKKGKKS